MKLKVEIWTALDLIKTKMAEGLKAVENFDATGEPSVVAAKWDRWKRSFRFYIAALGNVADARQKALLLHCGGQDL